MSGTEREVLERQLAAEIGFRWFRTHHVGGGHSDMWLQWDGTKPDAKHEKLWAALVDARLKLSEVERERDELRKLYLSVVGK